MFNLDLHLSPPLSTNSLERNHNRVQFIPTSPPVPCPSRVKMHSQTTPVQIIRVNKTQLSYCSWQNPKMSISPDSRCPYCGFVCPVQVWLEGYMFIFEWVEPVCWDAELGARYGWYTRCAIFPSPRSNSSKGCLPRAGPLSPSGTVSQTTWRGVGVEFKLWRGM